MNTVFLGLGSNLGNKEKNIKQAISLIKKECKVLKISTLHKTKPVGFLDQDWFLNRVIKIETKFTPLELLAFLKNIEKKLKKVKTFKNGPRIIDLDILFYNNEIINEKDCIIPHPRLHERLFVLKSMAEIEGDFVHPILEKSILELKKILKN